MLHWKTFVTCVDYVLCSVHRQVAKQALATHGTVLTESK